MPINWHFFIVLQIIHKVLNRAWALNVKKWKFNPAAKEGKIELSIGSHAQLYHEMPHCIKCFLKKYQNIV
jgi:hypothetical protein